jgi:hypothetical protein
LSHPSTSGFSDEDAEPPSDHVTAGEREPPSVPTISAHSYENLAHDVEISSLVGSCSSEGDVAVTLTFLPAAQNMIKGGFHQFLLLCFHVDLTITKDVIVSSVVAGWLNTGGLRKASI